MLEHLQLQQQQQQQANKHQGRVFKFSIFNSHVKQANYMKTVFQFQKIRTTTQQQQQHQ